MTTGQMTVIALRIVVPLLILRKPLVGGVLAMMLDALDVVIVELFGSGGMGAHYHSIDKVLDMYYLSLELWVSLRWLDRIPRLISIVLFGWRVIGFGVFELTGWRPVLFLFPNLFENWFLFYLVRNRFFPQLGLDTWRQAITWLVILYIPKMGQEYLLHVAEAQPWNWIKGKVGM
jgi:hypothetical protein